MVKSSQVMCIYTGTYRLFPTRVLAEGVRLGHSASKPVESRGLDRFGCTVTLPPRQENATPTRSVRGLTARALASAGVARSLSHLRSASLPAIIFSGTQLASLAL